MADFIESARAVLSLSERRIEATANNVANITTPGFKKQSLYSEVNTEANPHVSELRLKQILDSAQGRLVKTSNPLDLAIQGAGLFRLRGADGGSVYTRSGQFKRADDGRVVNAQGLALQSADGGDVVLQSGTVVILANGTVLEDGRPVAKIGVYRPASDGLVQPRGGSLVAVAADAVEEVVSPDLKQGMIEASNVALADEMMTLMEAMRQAEGGAKLIQVYDDLIGKAVSTFGGAK